MKTKILVSPKFSSPYEIIITKDIDFSCFKSLIIDQQVLIVSNCKISDLYMSDIYKDISCYTSKLNFCSLEEGEVNKNQVSLEKIYNVLSQNLYDRSSIIIALGGGVIGDVAGFAAATYLRGINFIQVPTTLLAQVDSSVGGKVAINHSSGKNRIGTFFHPKMVYIGIKFLETLPNRIFFSNISEVIKYGCITDINFFYWLENNIDNIKNRNLETLMYIISRSCEIKKNIVEKDEYDKKGLRILLNFGHTFGHAIEAYQNYQGYNHGEAVSIGIAIAAKFSYKLGYLKLKSLNRIISLLDNFGLPIKLSSKLKYNDIIKFIVHDKKNLLGVISFVFLRDIGSAVVVKFKNLEEFAKSFSGKSISLI